VSTPHVDAARPRRHRASTPHVHAIARPRRASTPSRVHAARQRHRASTPPIYFCADPTSKRTSMSAAPVRRQGDWTCPSCRNHCFATRDTCRCGTRWPGAANGGRSAAPAPRLGDWRCTECNYSCFASRLICRCGAPRGAPAAPVAPDAAPSSPGLLARAAAAAPFGSLAQPSPAQAPAALAAPAAPAAPNALSELTTLLMQAAADDIAAGRPRAFHGPLALLHARITGPRAQVAPPVAPHVAPVAPRPVHPTGDDEPTDDNPCVVCLTNRRAVMSARCGHNCLCIGCSRGLRDAKCPMCRGPWVDLLRVYS